MDPENAEFQLKYEVLINCRLWLISLHKEVYYFTTSPKNSYFFLKGQNAVLFPSAGGFFVLFCFLMLQGMLFGHCTAQIKLATFYYLRLFLKITNKNSWD